MDSSRRVSWTHQTEITNLIENGFLPLIRTDGTLETWHSSNIWYDMLLYRTVLLVWLWNGYYDALLIIYFIFIYGWDGIWNIFSDFFFPFLFLNFLYALKLWPNQTLSMIHELVCYCPLLAAVFSLNNNKHSPAQKP